MGAFFTAVFGSLFGFIAQYITKKIAYAGAVGASLLAITVAFYAAITALINNLLFVVTDQWILNGIFSVLPANFMTCMTAIWSAEILAFLYRHQLFTIKAVSSAN